MKWNTIEERYEESIIKYTYKILNDPYENKNMFYDLLTINRTMRNISENKLGPRTNQIGNDDTSRKCNIYTGYMIYTIKYLKIYC